MKATIFLALLALSSAAHAQDSELRRCRGIADAAVRLACYDAISLPTTPPPAAAAPVQGAASGAAVAPAGAPAAQAGARTGVPPEQFGFEDRAFQFQTESIESYIPGRFEGWDPNGKIKLANGQVWQVTDGSRRSFGLTNPKVTVRKGLFGAYYLDLEGYNVSPKVRRIE